MPKPYLIWDDGKRLTVAEIQQLTGLECGRAAISMRIAKAKKAGVRAATLAQQVAILSEHTRPVAVVTSGDDDRSIPLGVDKAEGARLKVIREALLLDEKRKQAEIETRLKRKEVFYLESITPAWSAMVVSVRESLRGMIPTLVDKILPLSDRNEALARAEDELSRHLDRVSEFDLSRELNEQDGTEKWTFTQTD